MTWPVSVRVFLLSGPSLCNGVSFLVWTLLKYSSWYLTVLPTSVQ